MAGQQQSGKQAEAAAAAAALAEQLKAAKAELAGLQEAAQGAGPKTQLQAAKAAVVELAASYKALAAAQREADKADAKRSKDEDKRARDEAKRQKEQQKRREDEERAAKEDKAALEEGASKAAESLKSGAEAVVKAAAAVVAAGASIVAGAVKLGVESTAAADKQRRALGYLTRGYGEASGAGRGVVQGDIAYRVTLALAGEKGVAPDVALERVRKLVDAKFGRGETELLFRVAADLGAVKGEGKAEEFLGQLEAIKRLDQKVKDARDPRNQRALQFERGQAQASALDKFAESGIKSSEVLGLLAQKGEDLRSVSRRLRQGKIDADEFSRAVAQVAGKDVVGAAGKGLDATINRAKIGLTSLFEGWDLSPIDEAGKRLDDALKSEAGADLKKALAEVGKAALDVVKNISKDDITSVLSTAASAAHSLADAIKVASDAAGDLAKFGRDIGLLGTDTKRAKGAHEVDLGDGRTITKDVQADKGAVDAGKAFDDGLAKGIDENAGKVKDAAARAAAGAVAGANDELGIHSPSRVAIEQGGYYGAGWEIGIDRSAPRVAAAAARLAGGVAGVGAASGVPGAAGGPGGAAGGGVYIHAPFAPVITIGAGGGPGELERARSMLADMYGGTFLPQLRQAQRDARELANG